ncbi:hypothetical protein C8J95_101140 [Elizabethkingia sp. YR214]|uniref:hypothetical protein n=1 Tax=Elizabethkingia sp. YR214 TaxID=2135667 RepID=UPI000D321700|nr:hypothetical protein [Elizabethkingia sp. YR214]PUB35466.1 hypothetical protein C8J95_101140 [Elizabethkingia sp. YR214]
MKKIKLNQVNLTSEKQLNREQLKNVFGGEVIFSTWNEVICFVEYRCDNNPDLIVKGSATNCVLAEQNARKQCH